MARRSVLWMWSTLAALLMVGNVLAAPAVSQANYEESGDSPTLAAEPVSPADEPGAESDEVPVDDEPVTDESSEDEATPTPDDPDSDTESSESGEDHEPAADEESSEHESTDADSSKHEADDAQSQHESESGDGLDEPELIQERYQNRAIKIEREVKQDANGNYVNHGVWKMWDPRGNVVAEGQFLDGERDGTWNRWYRAGEAEILKTTPYDQYTGPFISQATFVDGKLEGKWTIYDAKQHKITEWDFAGGQRNGKSIWYYPTGQKMREVDYRDGDIDGQYLEWTADNRLTIRDTYQGGRKLAKKVAEYSSTQKKSEGVFLFAKNSIRTPDDWWNAKIATYEKQGKDEKHGPWTSWYATGQKQMTGEYRNDAQVGKFVWWHLNGQKALEGTYVDGKQHGKWVWWHQNGQKSIQGEYMMGNPTGQWSWWGEDGKVNQAANLAHSEGKLVETPVVPTEKERPSRNVTRPKKNYVR